MIENSKVKSPIEQVYRYRPKTKCFFEIGKVPYSRSMPFFSEMEKVYPEVIAMKHMAKEIPVISDLLTATNATGIAMVRQIFFVYGLIKEKSSLVAFKTPFIMIALLVCVIRLPYSPIKYLKADAVPAATGRPSVLR